MRAEQDRPEAGTSRHGSAGQEPGQLPWAVAGDAFLSHYVASITDAHLHTYSADPIRLQEDISHELGVLEAAYRQRQVIELVQNGADALQGTRAGGRIEVILDHDALYVANEGDPVTGRGIRSLLYFGLSAKTGSEIGRLGVGFKSVLEVTSRPYLLSRSISLSFDRQRTRRLVADRLGLPDDTPVAVMRFAEVVDPFSLVQKFPALPSLLDWASTIVVLPLDQPHLHWLPETLSSKRFRREFLLFSPDVTKLHLQDRTTGTDREIQLSRDGHDLFLEDDADDRPSRWRVSTRTVRLDDKAKHDGGKRFERPELDLAWALPVDVTRPTREIWAFFPVQGVASSLPGILNAAWKLSEDRASVVQGDFNEFLLRQAAELVIDTITTHVPEDRPGLALELLPYGPAGGQWGLSDTGWVGQYLHDAIWELARSSPIVPAVDGSWHEGSRLHLWPEWINKAGANEIAKAWAEAVAEPDGWVHRSVMTDVRSQRARLLGAVEVPITAWLQAVRTADRPLQSAKAALELVTAIRSLAAASGDHDLVLDAAVVWTEDESWQQISRCRLDDEAPLDTRPAYGLQTLVRELHKSAGIHEHLGERTIVALATKAANSKLSDGEAEDFWTAVHAIGPRRSTEVLGPVVDLSGIPVRTASGSFRLSSSVLLPGQIVNAEEDPAIAVDIDFHSSDHTLLHRIGVVEIPTLSMTPIREWNHPHQRYLRHSSDEWYSLVWSLGHNPHSGKAWIHVANGPGERHQLYPSHIEVFSLGSAALRRRFTEWLMTVPGWDQAWEVQHRSVRDRYPSLHVPSPAAFFIREYGIIPTSLGSLDVKAACGSALADWGDILPVAQLPPESLAGLGLNGSLDEELQARWEWLFPKMSGSADGSEDGRAVRLLHSAASIGLLPPEDFELPTLTDSPSEATELRANDERVWVCPTELLGDWPAGWDFPDIERPPAEAIGDFESLTLEEYFPALAARANAVGVQVWECDQVLVGSKTVDVGQRGGILLISRSAHLPSALGWLVRRLLPQLSAGERDQLVEQHIDAESQKLAEAVRDEPDDARRLVRLLGESALFEACDALIPVPSNATAEQRAQQLLTMYGPATLQQLRRWIPLGLGVPGQWAGGDRAVQFVHRLGFDREFAGRPTAEVPDVEQVLGPTVAGDLHDFQREIAESVQEILTSRSRGVIDLPTGAGKTRVAIESILKYAKRQGQFGTVLWIAERGELCEQAAVQWSQLWRAKGPRDRELSVLRYWATRKPSTPDVSRDTVIVASRDQLMSRIKSTAADWMARAQIVVIDEAHHSTARSYLAILRWRAETNEQPFAVLGLSATPFKGDVERSEQLARLFNRSLVAGQTMGTEWKSRIRWLQDKHFLSHVEWQDLHRGEISPTDEEAALLLDQANLNTGLDLVNKRLARDDSRNEQILSAIRAMDPDWSVVVFAGSVTHAQHLAILLNETGISARPVWGDLTLWARRHAIEEFRAKRVRVLTNFNVLSEGFDAPKTRAVVIARMVQSDGLFLQMLGRGMRGKENGGTKKCLLVTTGETLPQRFDRDGNLDIKRHEFLWRTR